METLSISDKQGMEICENVGRMLVEELDSGDVWNRVEQMLADYLKKQQHKHGCSRLNRQA